MFYSSDEVLRSLQYGDPYEVRLAVIELERLGRQDLIDAYYEQVAIDRLMTRPHIDWKKKDWTEFVGRKATDIYTEAEFTSVKFYDTIIFRLDEVKSLIRLNYGAFRTMTTKERLQQVGNLLGIVISIYQRNFHWYLSVPIVDIHDIPFDGPIEFEISPQVMGIIMMRVPNYVKKWDIPKKKGR